MFFPQELDALPKLSGFEMIGKYGDYDYSNFADQSPKQFIICNKKA